MPRSKSRPTRRSAKTTSAHGKIRRGRKAPPERWDDYGYGLTLWTLPGTLPMDLRPMGTASAAFRKMHGEPTRPRARPLPVPSLGWLALQLVQEGKDGEMMDMLEILRSGVRAPGGL